MENYRQTIKEAFEKLASKDYLVDVKLYRDDRYCASVSLYPKRILQKQILSFWFVSPEDTSENLTTEEIWWIRHSEGEVGIGGKFNFSLSEPNRFSIKNLESQIKKSI